MLRYLVRPRPQADEFVCVYQVFTCPSRAGSGRGGVEMSRRGGTGCSMLVEDPVFSGDKDFPFYSSWKYCQFVVRSFSKD